MNVATEISANMRLLLAVFAVMLRQIQSLEYRAFHSDQIVCVPSQHELSKYYDACKIFRSKLSDKGDVVACKIGRGVNNEMISGCSPAFSESIKVDYILSYNSDLDYWSITANVTLWQVYHPLLVVFIVVASVLVCSLSDNDSNTFMLGALAGMSFADKDTDETSWNTVT